MVISPTPNKKNYLVFNGKITKAGWDFLKQCDKKNKDNNTYNKNK